MSGKTRSIGEVLQDFSHHRRLMQEELQKVIVGQADVIEQLFAAIFTRGHCLLVGVPGLAKTLMVSTLARILDIRFKRIQFTPDLMPSDITGTNVLEEQEHGRRDFRFVQGPIFANIVLADEINRTPPKTQAALLQAMQEREVTVGQETYPLPEPFFTIATQNPIEQEGTYPLPEAQLDRFMFNTYVDYPAEDEEFDIVRRTTADVVPQITPTLSGEKILDLQRIVRRVPVADHVIRYAMKLARLTRPHKGQAPEFVREFVSWGAGPRASQYLILGAKARAVLYGRFHAGCEDVRAVAPPVLRHRIMTNFNAEAEGVKPDDVIRRLIELAAVEEEEATTSGNLPKVLGSEDPGSA